MRYFISYLFRRGVAILESNSTETIKIVLLDQYEGEGKRIGDEFYLPVSLIDKGYSLEKVWREKEKTLELMTSKVKVSEIDSYDYKGNYLHYDKNRVENWGVKFTNEGIPKTIYAHGEYYNPTTIAQYGLQHYSLYLKNKDQTSKSKFILVADWLVNNQDARGGWIYSFDHDYYAGRVTKLKAPWYSAIAQGTAMSVLARADYLTQDKKYSQSALKAKTLMKTPVAKNGLLAKFENTFYFYEEAPTNPSSYILNGFMFAVIGLYDLYCATGDKEAKRLYDEGIKTLKRMLPLYDLGNRTAYDLTHYTTAGSYPNVAKWGYHITHIHLLATLNTIEKDPKMSEILLRWKGYLKGNAVKKP